MPDHEIAIIGAGVSGLGMAIALRKADMEDFAIFERAEDVGGTWRDNTYPGIGVDIPAQAYQFSYDLKPDWSGVFADGWEVKAYIDGLVERFGIRPFIRFGSEVAARTWDEEEQLWRLSVNGEEVTARFVVSAIGAFVEPKPVDIPGVEEFAGKTIRSQAWDHEYDLRGKRVAVIGTGASAVQIVPEIAREVGHLDVYQRTPIWVAPKFNPKTPRLFQAAFRHVPFLQRLVRKGFTAGAEFVTIFMVVHYAQMHRLVDGFANRLRNRWYRSQVPDEELRAKLTPSYTLGCKRPAVSNSYLRTFTRENVELVTDPIARITPTGVETADGVERPVDVLVLATGFRLATDPANYERTPVRGRDGFDLAAFYANNRARSYEGTTMPGLPNHFMMFGPFGFVGGTWHELVEITAEHVIRIVREAQRRGTPEVEVKEEACERWTAMVREKLEGSLWFHDACDGSNSYYFDRHGDTPYLRPTSSLQARRAGRRVPFDDYIWTAPRAVAPVAGTEERAAA